MAAPESTDRHIELYKKYRPNRWEDLIGQEKVARSLKNAVVSNKLTTAYLFAGPRGCGKTSTALILAKAINCENVQKDGNPCNECDTCRSIDEGRQPDVVYISAAQKSGVDDIRELVAQARLASSIKKRVIIIDEIHNLKQGKGFEALLIPLEEVNMPALFIFCTTEIEKVPATILSRVSPRKFMLVEGEKMTALVQHILSQEGIEASDEQVQEAVRRGRKSVRDTLTLLESLLSTGEQSSDHGSALLEALASRNVISLMTVTAEASADSVDFRQFAEQTFEDLRDLLLMAAGVSGELVNLVPVDDPKAIVKKLLGAKGILLVMNEVGAAITSMASGTDPRITFETCLVKAITQLNRLLKAAQAKNG